MENMSWKRKTRGFYRRES